jgi:hypothetical protein
MATWRRSASDQLLATCCSSSAWCIRSGVTCLSILIAAHKWFNLATIKGNLEAVRLRREIACQMSDAEIAAAQRAARDWLVGHRVVNRSAIAA